MSEVAGMLEAIEQGDPKAAEELSPPLYDGLRRLAAWHLFREEPGQTLQATALVHEACLRLIGKDDPQWNGRRHFFAAAAEANDEGKGVRGGRGQKAGGRSRESAL